MGDVEFLRVERGTAGGGGGELVSGRRGVELKFAIIYTSYIVACTHGGGGSKSGRQKKQPFWLYTVHA